MMVNEGLDVQVPKPTPTVREREPVVIHQDEVFFKLFSFVDPFRFIQKLIFQASMMTTSAILPFEKGERRESKIFQNSLICVKLTPIFSFNNLRFVCFIQNWN